jgi:hypothetical protein
MMLALATLFVWLAQPSLLAASRPFEGDWRITGIDHFDLAFRDGSDRDLARVAETAERAYRRLGASFSHELSLRPLIVMYRTQADVRQAIASRSFPGNREHVLWTMDVPAAEADGRFVHELTHVFVFDIAPGAARGEVPAWLQEGLAEFQRGEWTDADLETVRSLLNAGTFPSLESVPADDAPQAVRVRTVVGHLAIDFLVARAGVDAPRHLVTALRANQNSAAGAYRAAVKLAPADLDREFIRFVRDRVAR